MSHTPVLDYIRRHAAAIGVNPEIFLRMSLTTDEMNNFLEGSGWDFAYSASRDQFFCNVCKDWIPGGDTQQVLRDHAKDVHDAVPLENRYQRDL